MGLSKENIALVTVYLADMVQKAEMNRAGMNGPRPRTHR